jgi:hypothetical protein
MTDKEIATILANKSKDKYTHKTGLNGKKYRWRKSEDQKTEEACR